MRYQISLLSGALAGVALFATFLNALKPVESSILWTELSLSAAAGIWIGWEVHKALRRVVATW